MMDVGFFDILLIIADVLAHTTIYVLVQIAFFTMPLEWYIKEKVLFFTGFAISLPIYGSL